MMDSQDKGKTAYMGLLMAFALILSYVLGSHIDYIVARILGLLKRVLGFFKKKV